MNIRVTTLTALAATTALALTGCASSSNSTTSSKPKATKSVDCSADSSLSQAEWTAQCAGVSNSPTATAAVTDPGILAFGKSAQTTGDGGTGVLEITPTTVLYTKTAAQQSAANGIFLIVLTKDKAMTAVAADEPAPITGNGWSYIAPDGQQIDWDSGNSSTVDVPDYDAADPVQPGSYQWRTEVFDLTPQQAKGGTLMYTDGANMVFKWKLPSTTTGPQAATLQQKIK